MRQPICLTDRGASTAFVVVGTIKLTNSYKQMLVIRYPMYLWTTAFLVKTRANAFQYWLSGIMPAELCFLMWFLARVQNTSIL